MTFPLDSDYVKDYLMRTRWEPLFKEYRNGNDEYDHLMHVVYLLVPRYQFAENYPFL